MGYTLRRITFENPELCTRTRLHAYVQPRIEEMSVKFSRMDGPADLEFTAKSTNRTHACILHTDDQRIKS